LICPGVAPIDIRTPRPASNERQRQDHVRLSIGMVWHIR
jgi:hypothetical protein